MNQLMRTLAVTALAAPILAAAQADTRPTLAVLPFNNSALGAAHDTYAPLSKGIGDILITEFARNPGIRVVERENIQRLLDEQNLARDGRIDDATAARIGRILGAKFMVTGGFLVSLKDEMRIDLRVVEVETTRVFWTAAPANGKAENLMTLLVDLANATNRELRLPAIPAGPARDAAESGQATAKKVPFSAVMLYSRALEEQDKGNTSGAIALYRQVLKEFPQHPPAQEQLRKLGATD